MYTCGPQLRDKQSLDDQLEPIYNNSVQTPVIPQKSNGWESRVAVESVRKIRASNVYHDDDKFLSH